MATAYAGSAAAASILRIDLKAITDNYQLLRRRLGKIACAAAVKANAYGTGAAQVAPALVTAGCRTFFVATIDEGIALRNVLPDHDITIAVLNGVLAGSEATFRAHHLIPVINDIEQCELWCGECVRSGRPLDAMLHVDTGMNRLGLPMGDLEHLVKSGDLLRTPNWRCLISHLACADEPDHPANAEQLTRFQTARAMLPSMPASLANSAGIFLESAFHFDLARPGIALYGGNPQPGQPNPMRQAVSVFGRVLQTRVLKPGMTVGYGAACHVDTITAIATVAAGYADGYLRCLGNRSVVHFGSTPLPIVSRISMDLITIDITEAPPGAIRPGTLLEIIGDHFTPDDMAEAAGTISYEILTGLGQRYHRIYVGSEATDDANATEALTQ